MKTAIGGMICAAIIFATSTSWGVDRLVGTGQQYSTLAAAHNAAANGDTIIVKDNDANPATILTISHTTLNVTKGVTIRAEAGVRLLAASSGQSTAFRINGDNITIDGFIIENFQDGVSCWWPDQQSNITVRNCTFVKNQYEVVFSGRNWLIEKNNMNGVKRWTSGDSDYMRGWGDGITIRGNYVHGTNIPTDLGPGPDYAHTDFVQTYTNDNQQFKNVLIEGNYVTSCVQFCFLADEFVNPALIANVTIRGNVFWGQSNQPVGNILSSPSHGIFIGKNGGLQGFVIENNFFRNINNVISMVGQRNVTIELRKNLIVNAGTVYYFENTPQSVIASATNMLWSNNWVSYTPAGDIRNIDPKCADLSNPLGQDGIPMTLDDGWRPTATSALSYGPQIGTTPPPPVNTPPSVAIAPVAPATLAQGATTASVTATAIGADAEGAVTYRWTNGPATASWTAQQPVGTVRRTVTVTDTGGLTATAFVDTVVNPAPIPNNPPSANAGPDSTIQLAAGQATAQVTLNGSGADSDGSIVAYVWTGSPNPADVQNPVVSLAAGVYTFDLTVRDDDGATSAADTVQVTVLAAPVVPPTEDVATQKELDAAVSALTAAINALRADMILADSQERTARIAADNALGARIDNLPVPMTPTAIADAIATAIKNQPKVQVVGVTE